MSNACNLKKKMFVKNHNVKNINGYKKDWKEVYQNGEL